MFDTNGNNSYGGYAFNQGNGKVGTKQSSTLSQEEYARLVKNENAFSLALSETDVLRGICNHRTPDGMSDSLVSEPDGTVRCYICNYVFSPVDPSLTKEDIRDSVNLITDILQTIKLLFVDMPISSQREFFQIIPLLDKVPQLFELATKNFSKHENYNAWGYKGANMNTMNMFSMLSNVLNGGGAGYGAMGVQPGMVNPQSYSNMANPVFGAFGTPVGSPQVGMPVGAMGVQPGMVNPPMGAVDMYGRPIGYNPQTAGYSYGMETEEERKKREEEEKRRREEEEARKRAGGTVTGTATFTA